MLVLQGSLHLETIEVRKFTGYWVAKPGGRPQETTEDAEEKKRYADVAKAFLKLKLSFFLGGTMVWSASLLRHSL